MANDWRPASSLSPSFPVLCPPWFNSILMKHLIVNADDFGLTSGVNRAVIEGASPRDHHEHDGDDEYAGLR